MFHDITAAAACISAKGSKKEGKRASRVEAAADAYRIFVLTRFLQQPIDVQAARVDKNNTKF
jgi:hypothetical protein